MSTRYPPPLRYETFAYYVWRCSRLAAAEPFDLAACERHYSPQTHGDAGFRRFMAHVVGPHGLQASDATRAYRKHARPSKP
jgi:hypothetical protein